MAENYIPTVEQAHAFREISLDFGRPAEIFREAVANSLDAYATSIWLRARVLTLRGKEGVVIDMADNGIGMSKETIRRFLNLSDSLKPTAPPTGMVARQMTGYKGHGTKIYFNGDKLEVLTYDGTSKPVLCTLREPRGDLHDNKMPTAEIAEISLEELKKARTDWGFPDLATGTGTAIRVTGYHDNDKTGLEHTALRDYVRWFTRWGSWEPKLCTVADIEREETKAFSQCKLFLRGLGKEPTPNEDEPVPFGHLFPTEDCTDIRKLRTKDDVDPLKHYVRTWAFPNEPLLKNPEKRIDFVFAIEGEGARRSYNEMLRRQGRMRRQGDYLSEERYGLWLGKDFIPIQRFNEWVAERSEYTRMHAFVNSQDLSLTANRGSVENSGQVLLKDIADTVQKIFQERIQPDEDYVKFHDELVAIERHRHAKREGEDYKRRLKRLAAKEVVKIDGVEFFSPASEMDLIALVAGLQAKKPDLLPFVVREYDGHFGFDGLAARSKVLAINETEHLFVEFKFELKKEFDHSFSRLTAIVCWSSRVKDGEEVVDLGGTKGKFSVTAAEDGTKKRFIVIAGSANNVEVIVLSDLLKTKGIEFKPVGE